MPSSKAVAAKASSKSKPYSRDGAKAAQGVNIGAPSTHTQASRKGKKAWRKNIDITQEEGALELAREEERITGGKFSAKSDGDLFVVDTVGDVEVAQRLRRTRKPLRSLAVLSETSAVPSLTSRSLPSSSSSSSAKSRAKVLSKAEKSRLRRIARKETLDIDVDGKAIGASSADIRRTAAQLRDAWEEEDIMVAQGTFGEEGMVKRVVQAPKSLAEQRAIRQSAVENERGLVLPLGGTSYNPSAESHAELLSSAVVEEMELLKREAEEEERIRQLGGVVDARKAAPRSGDYAPGMLVGAGDEAGSESELEDLDPASLLLAASKKVGVRKTQAQRNRTLRKKALAEEARRQELQRQIHSSIGKSSTAKLRQEAEERIAKQIEKANLAKILKKEKERLGLVGGQKVGKHKVAKERVPVQLGEDLAETLRQVKPEGNLFRDRFVALQQKALVEPRVPQLPRRRNKLKEYEKHAYKRFV